MIFKGTIIAPDFGEIIATRRLEFKERHGREFTQEALAKKVGFKSAASLSYIERCRRSTMIRPKQFWALGRALNLSPEEMLEAAGYLPSAAEKILKFPSRERQQQRAKSARRA